METVMAGDFMGLPVTANATILGERWHKEPAAPQSSVDLRTANRVAQAAFPVAFLALAHRA
jgi:hypothetical protein